MLPRGFLKFAEKPQHATINSSCAEKPCDCRCCHHQPCSQVMRKRTGLLLSADRQHGGCERSQAWLEVHGQWMLLDGRRRATLLVHSHRASNAIAAQPAPNIPNLASLRSTRPTQPLNTPACIKSSLRARPTGLPATRVRRPSSAPALCRRPPPLRRKGRSRRTARLRPAQPSR